MMNTIAPTTDDWTPQAPVTGLPRFLSYMRYPVFSREWMTRRIKLFGVVGLIYYMLVTAEIGVALDDWLVAIACVIVLSLGNVMALTLGPWVASRRAQLVSTDQQGRRIRLVLLLLAILGGIVHVVGYNVVNNYFHARTGAQDVRITVGLKWDSVGPEFPDLPGTKVNFAPGTAWGIAPLIAVVSAGSIVWFYFLCGGFAWRGYRLEKLLSEQVKQSVRLKRLEQQKNEADQQLAILQAQIEPHFLFNTLASVRSLVTQDQVRAAAMIDGLSDYLRVTLPKLRTTETTATLGEQLDICTRYLELMRLRMGERFNYGVEIPDSLRQLQVPPLLLLPLVENAIKHGVEPKTGSGTVQINVTHLQAAGQQVLRIEVRDDGIGLAASAANNDVGQGVGLNNIRAQLKLRYGTRASLEVSSHLDGGTSAVLLIPSEAG